MNRTESLHAAVHAAVASVDDPEYPGVSITDLGLLEQLSVNRNQTDADQADVVVGLIPTFSGCPALAVIAGDVEQAIRSVPGVGTVKVEWLKAPAWSVSRISHDARQILANEFTVAVELGVRSPICPLCGGDTAEQSLFGPSRCRSVHRCTACGETVEVVRN